MNAFLSVRPLIVGVSRPCHAFHTSDGDLVKGLNGRGGGMKQTVPPPPYASSPRRLHMPTVEPCPVTGTESHRAQQAPAGLWGRAALRPGQARHRNHASWLTHCSHGKAGEFHAHPRTNWCPSLPSQHSTAPAIERPTSRFLSTLCHYFILLFGKSGHFSHSFCNSTQVKT